MRKLKSYCSKRDYSQLIKLTASAIQKLPAWRQDCSIILKKISGLNVYPVKFFEKDSRADLTGVYPACRRETEIYPPLEVPVIGAPLALWNVKHIPLG